MQVRITSRKRGRPRADFRGSFINTVHVSSALAAIDVYKRQPYEDPEAAQGMLNQFVSVELLEVCRDGMRGRMVERRDQL